MKEPPFLTLSVPVAGPVGLRASVANCNVKQKEPRIRKSEQAGSENEAG